jgi:hypothetical protein
MFQTSWNDERGTKVVVAEREERDSAVGLGEAVQPGSGLSELQSLCRYRQRVRHPIFAG